MWSYMWGYPWLQRPLYPQYGYSPYSLPYSWPMTIVPKSQQLAWLRDQEKMCEEQLKLIKEQIKELEGQGKKERV